MLCHFCGSAIHYSLFTIHYTWHGFTRFKASAKLPDPNPKFEAFFLGGGGGGAVGFKPLACAPKVWELRSFKALISFQRSLCPYAYHLSVYNPCICNGRVSHHAILRALVLWCG